MRLCWLFPLRRRIRSGSKRTWWTADDTRGCLCRSRPLSHPSCALRSAFPAVGPCRPASHEGEERAVSRTPIARGTRGVMASMKPCPTLHLGGDRSQTFSGLGTPRPAEVQWRTTITPLATTVSRSARGRNRRRGRHVLSCADVPRLGAVTGERNMDDELTNSRNHSLLLFACPHKVFLQGRKPSPQHTCCEHPLGRR